MASTSLDDSNSISENSGDDENRDASVSAVQSNVHGSGEASSRTANDASMEAPPSLDSDERLTATPITASETGSEAVEEVGDEVLNAESEAEVGDMSTESAALDVGTPASASLSCSEERDAAIRTDKPIGTKNQRNHAASLVRRQRSSHRQRRLGTRGDSASSFGGSKRGQKHSLNKASIPEGVGGGDSDVTFEKFDYEIEEEKQQQQQQRWRTDGNSYERKVGHVEEPSNRKKPKSAHNRDDSSTSGEIPPHHLAGATASDDDPMDFADEGYDEFMINNTGGQSLSAALAETDRLEKTAHAKGEASDHSDSPGHKEKLGYEDIADTSTLEDKFDFEETILEHDHVPSAESMASDDQLSTAATTTSSGRGPTTVANARDRRGHVLVPDRPGAYNVPGRAYGQVPQWGRRTRPVSAPTAPTTQSGSFTLGPTVSTPRGPVDSASRSGTSSHPSRSGRDGSNGGNGNRDRDARSEIVVSAYEVEDGEEDCDDHIDEDEAGDNVGDCDAGDGDSDGDEEAQGQADEWEQEPRETEAIAVATPANSTRTSEGATENASRRRKKRRTRRCKSWKLRAGIVGLCVALAVLAAIVVLLILQILRSKDDGGNNSSRMMEDNSTPKGRTTGQSGEQEGDGLMTTTGACKLLKNITPTSQQQDQFDLLREWLVENGVSSAESLNAAQCTNQQRALAWISFMDDRSQRIMGNQTSDIDTTALNAVVRRYAVAVLYFELEGGSWHSRTGWLSEESSECMWQFLGCNRKDMLTEVQMMNNAAAGKIPKEVAFLPSLVRFEMSGNQISSTIPSEIGSLADLETLDLSNNQITGTIPSTIESMVSLESLDLSENRLGGLVPTQLSYLPSLREINLDGNNFTDYSPEEFCTNTVVRLCTDSQEECSCCVMC